jgi:RNA polymerase sigma-70 factor (ECF subfamily)
MREPSDEALMEAYAGGDVGAFERLYARHRGPLYRYILRQVGEAATANDLYQGSWEKIIKARAKYTASAPFKAWMYRIAHNHLVDHFRKSRPAADLEPESMASNNPGPEQMMMAAESAAGLAAAVQQLPAEQREALLLKLESGLGLQSIAEVTGVKPETAKSRLRYALGKLRASLANADDESGPGP